MPRQFRFPGGVGKTWQPGEFTQLITDVTSRVFDRFGDDTTLGAHVAEWKERGW